MRLRRKGNVFAAQGVSHAVKSDLFACLIWQKMGAETRPLAAALFLPRGLSRLGLLTNGNQYITSLMRNATMVATTTCTIPGIMKLWLTKYLPITVVPLRSKFTVAMSEG